MSSEKEKQIFRVEQILAQEDYLFCDTSITSLESSAGWYYDNFYHAHSFPMLNSDLLQIQKEGLESFLSVLMQPKVLVVEGVSLELKRIRDKISENIRFLKKEMEST